MGAEVEVLESRLAEYVGVEHCICVSSGTDALLIAMMALGLEPGDEVITCSFSFFATAEAISAVGATPVFVDVRPDTFNLDPAGVLAKLSAETRVVIPVHLFGLCADMDALRAVVPGHVPIIEDAAQAIGTKSPLGPVGSLGAYGCFSFFPSRIPAVCELSCSVCSAHSASSLIMCLTLQFVPFVI